MKTPGIYKIYSLSKPYRVYVGSSVNLHKRMRYHFSDLENNKHGNSKLQRHYNKYGADDLVFAVIEPCMPEFLIIREQYYIDTLNPYFNICRIAGSPLGIKRSEETKKKLSELNKGKTLTDKVKQELSNIMSGEGNPFYGKVHTDETKKILSEKAKKRPCYFKGKKHTEEAKQKMREAKTGKKASIETKAKMSLSRKGLLSGSKHPFYGKQHSDEHKEKISKATSGENNPFYGKKHSAESREKIKAARAKQVITEETKQKISELHKGRKRSAETCLRISENKKKYWEEKRLAQLN